MSKTNVLPVPGQRCYSSGRAVYIYISFQKKKSFYLAKIHIYGVFEIDFERNLKG